VVAVGCRAGGRVEFAVPLHVMSERATAPDVRCGCHQDEKKFQDAEGKNFDRGEDGGADTTHTARR